jgi:hypothetical protein
MTKLKSLLFSALLVLCASVAVSQTAVLLPQPKIQFLNGVGVPLAGGCVQTYAAGTTTPQATFTDSSGSVSNTNPVILDSAGRASIFLSQGIQYKFVVTSFGGSNCSTGTLQYTQDNVALGSTLTVGGSNTQVQYNSSGVLAGSSNFTWNNATQTLSIGALNTTSGGALAGNFTGNPILSGNPSFTGLPQFTGGGTLYGSWAGGPTAAIATAPSGAAESGNTVTITTLSTCTFVANQPVTIAGVGVSSYNGTWSVLSGCGGGSTFTYVNPTSGLGTSGGGTVIGSPVLTNGISVPGTGLFKNLGGIRYADQFSGSDCGAKINAADSDLGATPGIIYVNQACGLTISTAVSVSANHSLQFIQGGTWTQTAIITLLDKTSIVCRIPSAFNEDILTTNDPATVFKQAASTNLAEMVLLKGSNIELRGCAFDGNNRGGGNGSTVGIVTDTSVATTNSRGRIHLWDTTVENTGGDGIQILSTSTNNQALGFRIDHVAVNRGGNHGIFCQNTTDVHISETNLELNAAWGIKGLGCTATVTYSDISTNNNGGIWLQAESSSINGGNSGGGWSILNNGIVSPTGTSGMVATANAGIFISGYDGTNCNRASANLIAGNIISFQSSSQTNAFDAIHIVDSGSNLITGNVLNSGPNASNEFRDGIFIGVVSCAGENADVVTHNRYFNTFGTPYVYDTKTSHGFEMVGAVPYHQVATAAGCATAASIGATCTTAVSWPVAFGDTSYRAQCIGEGITSGIPLNGGITTIASGSGTFQTVAMTAAAAQYTNIRCTADHN